MSQLIDKLDSNLKQAMLKGDKQLVSTLRGLKSAIQYAKVDSTSNTELSEEEIIRVLQKESKKRADAVDLYSKAGETERAQKEENEKKIIDEYLPEPLSTEEINKLVDEAETQFGSIEKANMGQVIGYVREKSAGRAEGSMIAILVKERLGQ